MRKKNQPTLFVQIPCLNEEKTIASVIKEIPKSIKGISKINILVIDDGSSDKTVDIALKFENVSVLKNKTNIGLARTFARGIHYCFSNGADIVVNTDGDKQYPGKQIKDLIQPILENRADLVVGVRFINEIKEFSYVKKRLQKIGSSVVSFISGRTVEDVTSGFRAFNKKAASKVNVASKYTYTLETLIQLIDST